MSGYNDIIDQIERHLELQPIDGEDLADLTKALESLRPRKTEVVAAAIYGAKTRLPYVELRIGDANVVQWPPEDAREHARAVLEAAEAADQDAFLMAYFVDRVGATDWIANEMLQEYRAFRSAQRERTK